MRVIIFVKKQVFLGAIARFLRGIDQWRETVQVNEIELITDWELAHKQEEGLLR